MINKSTARIRFQNKVLANECLDFFEIHNKLVLVHIDNKEIMHKGIISDQPKGIPELFDAMDSWNDILKMERMRKRVWNNENNIANYIASENIVIAFKDKSITDASTTESAFWELDHTSSELNYATIVINSVTLKDFAKTKPNVPFAVKMLTENVMKLPSASIVEKIIIQTIKDA